MTGKLLPFVLLLAACSSAPPPSSTIADTSHKDTVAVSAALADTITGTLSKTRIQYTDSEYFIFVEQKLPLWISYHKKIFPGFNVHRFKPLRPVAFSGSAEGKFHRPSSRDELLTSTLYCWSPDSGSFVDIYSYRYEFETKNGKLVLLGADPESEIALTTLHDSVIYRMDFTGTGQGYDDVAWIDNSRLVIAGGWLNENEDAVQFYFQVCDLQEKKRVFYVSRYFPVPNVKAPGDVFGNYLCRKFPQYCPD